MTTARPGLDPTRHAAPPLPEPRGPLSSWLVDLLGHEPRTVAPPPAGVDDPVDGDDAALALYTCYELHYRGFAGVDPDWEWEPSLLAVRLGWERAFCDRLDDLVGPVVVHGDVAAGLRTLLANADGPSLSTVVAESGTLDELREFLVHRSAYQLKEADPHSWALPRLAGAPKAALVQIQADEYGAGVTADMHAELFALTLQQVGLDERYGAYLDVLPGVTLATVNLVSLFGLHRRRIGALVGHLAVFEMTSVEPMGRYSAALRRHGFGPWARLFYDTHVVADAQHQFLAADELAAALVQQQPTLARDLFYGAQAVCALEGRFTAHLLSSWAAGATSLRQPVPAAVGRTSGG